MTTFETFSSATRSRPLRTALAAVGIVCEAVATRLRVWKNRRQVATLLDWDARMLNDIGLTQGDVYSALSGSAGEDPTDRLSMLAVERRFGERAQASDRLRHAAELRSAGPQYRRINEIHQR